MQKFGSGELKFASGERVGFLKFHLKFGPGELKYASGERVGFLSLFMPPTLKKWGHIRFGLVCVCVCMEVRDIILKLHVWIPHGKIADIFLVYPELSPLVKF